MSQTLRIKGQPKSLTKRLLGRVTFVPVQTNEQQNCFFALRDSTEMIPDLRNYAGVLIEHGAEDRLPTDLNCPLISGYDDLSFISQDTVVAVNPGTGSTHLLYRPESLHNMIFATARCNSNCLMCSQPPALSADEGIVDEHLRLIDLIKEPPEAMGITGGEPTLLKDGLVRIVTRLKERFPDTPVQMLTNGRLYAHEASVKALGEIRHPDFISDIPLYADVASIHDYIVQAKGAFDETIQGLYHAAKHGLKIEIRVVLHRQTLPRLLNLMEYIYRNLPFVSHVALMGLENMGYVKKNWTLLWIDPFEYSKTLEKAVKYLFYRGVPVSIYNLQLCLMPKSIWCFMRRSISDYKNIYIESCNGCGVRKHCAGLFISSEVRHSSHIGPIEIDAEMESKIFESQEERNSSPSVLFDA